MIENYRTGLLWNTLMKDSDVQAGLDELGFQYQTSTDANDILSNKQEFSVYPNPGSGQVTIYFPAVNTQRSVDVNVFSLDGRMVLKKNITGSGTEIFFDCSALPDGMYILQLVNGNNYGQTKLVIQK
ncbi:T9SS type A sorting domain-containing protein [Prolixibacter bellariivorans]|nr:T9SS type A sorting domain-containing protein [Prolixibacter bellariivorans]